MSAYQLRSAFPANGKEYRVGGNRWICELEEVSDLRPDADRLSWYLVFHRSGAKPEPDEGLRKLEIVTTASGILQHGWRPDLDDRITEWLSEGGDDDRLEWLNQ